MEKDIRKMLAGKLREFRKRAGLTAKEVGDVVGKSEKTVSGWEHGRGQPDADMLFQLCELYKIKSIAEFYTNKSEGTDSLQLSPDEEKLLHDYRNLNEQGKAYIRQTMYMALPIYIKHSHVPDLEQNG